MHKTIVLQTRWERSSKRKWGDIRQRAVSLVALIYTCIRCALSNWSDTISVSFCAVNLIDVLYVCFAWFCLRPSIRRSMFLRGNLTAQFHDFENVKYSHYGPKRYRHVICMSRLAVHPWRDTCICAAVVLQLHSIRPRDRWIAEDWRWFWMRKKGFK